MEGITDVLGFVRGKQCQERKNRLCRHADRIVVTEVLRDTRLTHRHSDAAIIILLICLGNMCWRGTRGV